MFVGLSSITCFVCLVLWISLPRDHVVNKPSIVPAEVLPQQQPYYVVDSAKLSPENIEKVLSQSLNNSVEKLPLMSAGGRQVPLYGDNPDKNPQGDRSSTASGESEKQQDEGADDSRSWSSASNSGPRRTGNIPQQPGGGYGAFRRNGE